MRHVVLGRSLAFQRKDPKEPTLAVGPEEIVESGGDVPGYVDEFTVAALVAAGAIAPVGDPAPDAAEPEDLGPAAPAAPADGQPDARASRGEWEAYATSGAVGMTADEAASYPNKQALIDAVGAKLAGN